MSARHIPIVLSIILTFVLFAVLMNSVGPVILQSVLSFGVTKTEASLLEGFKDLSVAAGSFFVALYLGKLGYRRGTALALLCVAAACFFVPFADAFWALELQFAIVGVAFAVGKTSVYVIIGLVTEDRRTHASMTSLLEGCFMLGVLSSFWLFSLWLDPVDPANRSWLGIYHVLGTSAIIVAAAIALAPLNEGAATDVDAGSKALFLAMPRLLFVPFVLAFLACAFLDVLVEQSINSWLPTFNREVMHLSTALSIQLASLYALAIALGRLAAGIVLRRVSWVWVCSGGIVLASVLLAVAVPLTAPAPLGDRATWIDLPLTAFAVPLVGFMLAPIYPTLCSAVLSALPKPQHAPMTGLILASSALGGTIGSLITGHVFAALSGRAAFLGILPPLLGLLMCLFAFHRQLGRAIDKSAPARDVGA